MASKLDLKKLRNLHRQFFLVIYPETDADVNAYHCGGGLDLGLNEVGIEDARKLSRRFKKNPLKIKKIYSSPELRAVQMADFLHDELKGKLVLSRDFSDQNLGEIEGTHYAPGESAKATLAEPIRGESDTVFSLRVRSGLEAFMQDTFLCVLVTHPRVGAKILSWMGLENKTLERGKMYAIDLPVDQGSAHLREV
jgi:broad specificity phosphatase PhoE